MPRAIAPTLAAAARLRDAGAHVEAHRQLVALAAAHPDDAAAQAEAAFASDRLGREAEALRFYQRAFELGGPPDDRPGFLLGFGSTLRNVGRVDDAVAVLGEAVLAYPEHAALRAFLALALGSAGHHGLALATMLEAGLAASPTAFAPYRRALGEYLRALQEAAVAPIAATPAPATPAAPGPGPRGARRRAPATARRASRSRRSR